MKKHVSKYWIVITIILSLVFIAFVMPLSIKNIGMAKAVSYTFLGIAVFGIAYFIRSYIFSDFDEKKDND